MTKKFSDEKREKKGFIDDETVYVPLLDEDFAEIGVFFVSDCIYLINSNMPFYGLKAKESALLGLLDELELLKKPEIYTCLGYRQKEVLC